MVSASIFVCCRPTVRFARSRHILIRSVNRFIYPQFFIWFLSNTKLQIDAVWIGLKSCSCSVATLAITRIWCCLNKPISAWKKQINYANKYFHIEDNSFVWVEIVFFGFVAYFISAFVFVFQDFSIALSSCYADRALYFINLPIHKYKKLNKKVSSHFFL